MNLSIIGRLPAQNTYCCKEGIVEVGMLDYPLGGTIWCCAKCGHPTEERAKHPVIVEFCKRLVQKVRVVDVVPSVHLDRCNCCRWISQLLQINLSTGDYATVCPSCRAVYSHPDDEKLYGVSAEKLAGLLGEDLPNAHSRLAVVLKVFEQQQKVCSRQPSWNSLEHSFVEAMYPNGVVRLLRLGFNDGSFALVSPQTYEVYAVTVSNGEVGMNADRLGELLEIPKEDFTNRLASLIQQKGFNI